MKSGKSMLGGCAGGLILLFVAIVLLFGALASTTEEMSSQDASGGVTAAKETLSQEASESTAVAERTSPQETSTIETEEDTRDMSSEDGETIEAYSKEWLEDVLYSAKMDNENEKWIVYLKIEKMTGKKVAQTTMRTKESASGVADLIYQKMLEYPDKTLVLYATGNLGNSRMFFDIPAN